MTYYTDIQSAQSLVLPPYSSKRLLVRSPLSVVEQINPEKYNLWQFDPTFYDDTDTSDYVYLVFFPEYTVEDEKFGEGGYKNTFSRSSFVPTTTRKGFTAKISQPLRIFYDIIDAVVSISKTSTFNRHSPIKIIDFCRGGNDKPTVISEGDVGTIRWGQITISKHPQMVQGQIPPGGTTDYCLEPWEFKFTESVLRIN
jgi:hypothetical protein